MLRQQKPAYKKNKILNETRNTKTSEPKTKLKNKIRSQNARATKVIETVTGKIILNKKITSTDGKAKTKFEPTVTISTYLT